MTPILSVLLLSALSSQRPVHACQDCVTGLTCYSGRQPLDDFMSGRRAQHRRQPLDDFMSGRRAQHRRQQTCAEADLCLRAVHDGIVVLKCAQANSTNHGLPLGCSDIAYDDVVAVESCVCNFDLCNGLVSVSRPHNVTRKIQARRNAKSPPMREGFQCYVCRVGNDVTCPAVTCETGVEVCVTDRYRSVTRRTCGSNHAKYALGCHVTQHEGHTAEYCYCDTALCNGVTKKPTAHQGNPRFMCHVCVGVEGTECPARNCGGDVTSCVTVKNADRIERKCGERFVSQPPGCVRERVDDVYVEVCHCRVELCNGLRTTDSSAEGLRMTNYFITTLCIELILLNLLI